MRIPFPEEKSDADEGSVTAFQKISYPPDDL